MGEPVRAEEGSLATLRAILLFILFLGMLGTGAELLLLGHYEDWRQWIPLALTGAGSAVAIWHFAASGTASMRAMQITMIAFILSGIAGVYYHIQGSAEFKLESNPSLAGWKLLWTSVRGQSPPSLAPAVMVQLGLLGLASTFRQPALANTGRMKRKGGESRCD